MHYNKYAHLALDNWSCKRDFQDNNVFLSEDCADVVRILDLTYFNESLVQKKQYENKR